MFAIFAKTYPAYYFLPLLVLLSWTAASAQLNADFSMDRSGGCSPLAVSFTNRTTGASANAVYSWDFGNGNTSLLKDGGAIYTIEQTYTITLTVQDGPQQSSKTQQLTVYKAPVVRFSVSPAKICLSTPVTFTSNSDPGNGTITGYAWDFGDGATVKGYTNSQQYTYYMEQKAAVSLTVTNNYGCHATLKQPDIVTIIPALTANFSADKKVLCLVSDPVQFTNNSAGPGTLDYLWDFGDGQVSTQLNPTYIFNKKGIYSVSLKVHSSEGCTAVSTQTNSLNVASYSTDFTIPSPICNGSYVSFNSQSTPSPDNSVWEVDGAPQYYSYNSLSHVFYTSGAHTITLKNTFGGCPQSASKQISVKDLPVPGGFSTDITGKCGSPVAVNFKDLTPTAVKWEWDFNYYYYSYPQISATKQSPSYTYTEDGSHTVWLRVTNADGCSATTVQNVLITRPTVGLHGGTATLSSCGTLLTTSFGAIPSEPLTSLQWDFGDGGTSTDITPVHTFQNTKDYTVTLKYTTLNGCTGTVTIPQYRLSPPPPVTIHAGPENLASCATPISTVFGINSTEPLTSINWSFGDGSTSTDPSPSHTFTGVGHYTASLKYITQSGCTGTVYLNTIIIDAKINSDITITPNPVCGNTPASFSIATNIPDLSISNWNFGDGNSSYYLSPSVTHSYGASGVYTVSLYVKNIGGCDTTMTKKITVNPPFPQITGHTNTCDGTRGEVVFTQASVQATSVIWNFGDGATATVPGSQATIKHVYTKTGTYFASLTAVNGQCSLSVNDPSAVNILLKQSPVLTGSKTAVCSNAPVDIQISGLDKNPYQGDNPYYYSYYYAGYYFQRTEYRDGNTFNGNRSDNGWNYRWTTNYNATLSNFKTGEKDIRFILTSYVFGCQDTTNFMPLAIKGATGGFKVVADKLCYQSPVILEDTSHSTPDNPILTWQWNFGDGQTATNNKGGSISHTYANPGGYNPSLQITDAAGCSANIPYTQYVNVYGPKAAFSASGTDVHLNTTVYFYNNTNDYGNSNTVYNWDFGDGSTSTDPYPSHTYSRAGTYTATLTATNPALPCSSTAIPVVITVRNFNSAFSFSSSFVAGSCPPVLVSFQNTSYNYTRVDWDFGDGITAGNINYPSHIYEKPGRYIVTLNVYAYNGVQGKFIDSIIINIPVASIKTDPSEACIGNTVILSSTARYTNSYSWDFGDGSIVHSAEGIAEHRYLTAGNYKPALLVQNDAGCAGEASLPGTVKIRPNPVISLSPVNPIICRDASIPLQASAAGAIVYEWLPASGLSNSSIPNPVASPKTTTNYTLSVKDEIGCQNSAPLTIEVVQPGNLQVTGNTAVCAGDPLQLNATGEMIYRWVNNTTGLSNTAIANPVALAPATTTYTVQGSDTHSCFIDQKSVTVTVLPLPVVDPGPNVVVQAGYDTRFNPVGSSDIIEWKWTPAQYLSCYDCASPLCTPLAGTTYTVTVKGQDGCKASGTIAVKVACEESRVRIPNAFTPDGNGSNDVFVVKGISIIKHMVIFSRWGEKVYERDNFIAGDRSSCWDGTYRGQKSPSGAYIYYIEMECPTGGVFTRKGSLILIR